MFQYTSENWFFYSMNENIIEACAVPTQEIGEIFFFSFLKFMAKKNKKQILKTWDNYDIN